MRKRSSVPERIGHRSAGENPVEGDRQFVTALFRGLELLRCFTPEDQGLGNLDLSKRTGLGPSTVSRLTYTLTRLGYLSYDENTGRYKLGVAVLELGFSCLAGFGIRRVAQPYMQEVADKIGGGLLIALSVRDKLQMTYVACARSEGVMSLQLDVGSRLPIELSAAGRAYMGKASEAELEQIMTDLHDVIPKNEFPKLASEIYESIDFVREHGYSMNLGNWRPEVNTIGVAFTLSQDRNRIYSLTCGGARYLLSKERIEKEAAPLMFGLVDEISKRSMG
ncbi:MAG: IclR family transcriptional regulator [Methyloligellaceae bacterium]